MTVLVPPAAEAYKEPEVDLAPVSKKPLSPPAHIGAESITIIRAKHRRRAGGRRGGPAPTAFVWTPLGPSSPSWPHQGASRHVGVFARHALTPSPPPWPHQGAYQHGPGLRRTSPSLHPLRRPRQPRLPLHRLWRRRPRPSTRSSSESPSSRRPCWRPKLRPRRQRPRSTSRRSPRRVAPLLRVSGLGPSR